MCKTKFNKITGLLKIISLVTILNVFTCFWRNAFCMFKANKVFVLYLQNTHACGIRERTTIAVV